MVFRLRFLICLAPGLLMTLLAGCGTTYVDTARSGSQAQTTFQPVVFFEVNPELAGREPNCINVLPFADERGLDKEGIFRKAFHAQLSLTGVRLIPLQSKNQGSAEKIACDFELRGKVLENTRVFLGIYSEYRASAEVELIEVSTRKFFWRAKHNLVKRSGGLPLDIISAAASAASAALNLESAQAGRVSFELADRVVRSIPNLAYREVDTLAVKAAQETPLLADGESVYQFIARAEKLPPQEQIKMLEEYFFRLSSADSQSRQLIAQRLLQLDKDSIAANRWALDYQFRQGNHAQAVEIATFLISKTPNQPSLYITRAQAFSTLGNRESAVRDYVKAVALGDETEFTLIRLGGAYGALGRFDLAIATYDRLLKKDPSNAKALLFSGVALAADGDLERAYENLRRALVLSLARDDKATARWAVNALHSTGTYDSLPEVDRRFVEGKL